MDTAWIIVVDLVYYALSESFLAPAIAIYVSQLDRLGYIDKHFVDV